MLCYARLGYAMLFCTMLYHAMLCYAMVCYGMLCCTMLRNAMLYYAVLCYAMLCYAMVCYAVLCYAMLCCTMLYYAMLCADRLQRAAPGMSHEDASSLVFVEPQTSDAFQWRGHTVVRTGFPLSHGRVITAQLHQHQLSTGQLTAQMEQVQEKTHKAERETLRQRDEIEEQARLIQEL